MADPRRACRQQVRRRLRVTGIARVALSVALIGIHGGVAAQTTTMMSIAFSNEVEASLVRALEILKTNGIQPALRELDATLLKNPNFRLGHQMKGDLLMAKAGSPVAFGGSASPPELVASLRDEAKVRFNRYFDAPPPD